MYKKLVIFDLDGTLLNTLEDLTDSVNFVLKKYKYLQKTSQEVKNAVGNGVYKLMERVIPEGKSNPNYLDIVDCFKEHYAENMYNKTTLYSGIEEMLKILKSSGCKIAVVSNKFDLAVKELCSRYLRGLTDFCAGENEALGIKKKPSPEVIFSVINNFSVSKEQTVYIGDSEVDIQTSENAGIDCVSVTWGFKTKEFLIQNGAKFIAEKPEEIVQLILK